VTKSRLFSAATLLALLALTGCGSDAPPPQKKEKVSGKITLDGKPLKTGRITFDALNGQPPSDCDILDGSFEGNVPVGKCKVMITSIEKMTMKEKLRRDGQKVIEGPGYDDMVEVNLLPDRYNAKSEIKREVEAGKTNEFKFELQSK